jgi:hypothetical protein
VNIPYYRHNEKRCKEAMEVELARFDTFDAYEENTGQGQETLGTCWVLAEKVKMGVVMIKARLVMRGDQKNKENIQKDSPTVRKAGPRSTLSAT